MLLFALILLGCEIHLGYANVTSLTDHVFEILSVTADWTSAQNLCRNRSRILMPDVGHDLLWTGVLDNFDAQEPVWLNAKTVSIAYGGTKSVSLKYSYLQADLRLTSYLCYDSSSGASSRNTSCEPLAWKEAQSICMNTELELLNVSTPEQLKKTVFLLKKDVTFWVDQMPNFELPSMVSESLLMTEECLVVMKQSDGSLLYNSENCSNRHSYVCVLKHFEDQFAPAVTRIPRYLGTGKPKANSSKIFKDLQDVGSPVGGYIAAILVTVTLVLAVVGVGYYLRHRWWKRKDLTSYIQSVRQSSSTQQAAQPPIERIQLQYQPCLQLTLWTGGHQLDD